MLDSRGSCVQNRHRCRSFGGVNDWPKQVVAGLGYAIRRLWGWPGLDSHRFEFRLRAGSAQLIH